MENLNAKILGSLRAEIVMKMEKARHARDAGQVPTTNSIEMTFAEAEQVKIAIDRVIG